MEDRCAVPVREQIASLASQEPSAVDANAYDFEDRLSKIWISQFRANPAGQERPNPLIAEQLVSYAFRRLRINSPNLKAYISEREPEFLEDLKNQRLNSSQVKIGNSISQLAPVRRVFPNLRYAVEDIHGAIFDEVLDRAEKFGLWLIEHSVAE